MAAKDLPPPPIDQRCGACAHHFRAVPTDRLVHEARARWEQFSDDELAEAARQRGEHTVHTFLVALHERADRSVFDAALELINRAGEADRVLGLCILRELGPCESRPVFPETWELLEGLADRETGRVLAWALRCLGWLHSPRALSTLLRYVDHSDPLVRFVVADNLLGCAPEGNDPSTLAALLRLSEDEDPEVRWAALYDINEHVTMDTPELRAVLTRRCADSSPDVREQALEALGKRAQREWPRVAPGPSRRAGRRTTAGKRPGWRSS
ncbi:MAG: HEAT repeat domain-containing protein [Candidatus Eremiobacterota bacterium]